MVAAGKSILVRDYDTALYILQKEYYCDEIKFSNLSMGCLEYLTAYTLIVDDSLDWMINNGLMKSIEDVYKGAIVCLLSIKPPGYEYTVLKYLDVDTEELATRDLLDIFLANKDYDSFRKAIDACANADKETIAYTIVHSGNMEVYNNPSVLGLTKKLTPTRELLKSAHVIGCSQDIEFLEPHKELLEEGDDMFDTFNCTDKNTKVFLWKLQFEDFRDQIENQLTYFSPYNLDLANNGETIQDYLDFIKKMSELFDIEELEIFAKLCYCFDSYDAREIFRHYKSINKEIPEELTDIITGTNLYEDKEYYELLNIEP